MQLQAMSIYFVCIGISEYQHILYYHKTKWIALKIVAFSVYLVNNRHVRQDCRQIMIPMKGERYQGISPLRYTGNVCRIVAQGFLKQTEPWEEKCQRSDLVSLRC